ncbi:MAG: hypothetical protein IJ153_04645 [Clostridia bacterium]|nr:hypothetical protein [Clostridia bacterium]
MSEELLSATPYDDVFKTLIHDCKRLVIPLINEIFGENYSMDEMIRFENTENVETLPDGSQQVRWPDAVFIIGKNGKRYHIECQTQSDSTIIIRIFEYDSHIAREHFEVRDGRIIFRFPASAIVFLRNNSALPKRYPARIELADGRYLDFDIQALKMQDYSLEELFQKNLYLLIPFYLFNLEKMVRKDQGQEASVEAVKQTLQEIVNRLQSEREETKIDTLEYGVLLQMAKKVGINLMENYQHVREGVEAVMGGNVIHLEIVDAYNAGQAAKEKESIQKAYDYFIKEKTKEESLESVAKMYGKSVGEIAKLCEPANAEKIYSPAEDEEE